MIRTRATLFITAGVACTTLLVGCGSSGSSSSSPASGNGDKTAFCADNATLDKATASATTPADLVPILKADQSTITDFSNNAPSDIAGDAKTLVDAANAAISSGDASGFGASNVQQAGKNVDSYCGENADGSSD